MTKKAIDGNHIAEAVKVGEKQYILGQGGLHTVDEPGIWEADHLHRILDMDVRSFYPSLIEIHALVPAHLPKRQFLHAFSALKRMRLEAKDQGRKALADGLKISVNSLFGKTGSAYGWLTDPTALLKCTVMGQLTLLTFVDLLQVEGVDVISANTDGITFRVRRDIADAVIEACNAWAAHLGYGLDWAEYTKLARRDINNYLAIYAGGIKSKGAYNYDITALGKKATNRIAIDAAIAYFAHGTPIEDTVRANRDINKIVDYFKCSKGYHIEDANGVNYGGIARWYIAETGGVHLDKVKVDGKRTQLVEAGALVINILPESYPDNVDTQHYIDRAQALVDAIINPEVKFSTTISRAEWSRAQHTQHEVNYDCTAPDLYRCKAIPLPQDAWTERVKGSGYDTMKHLLVKLWLQHGGNLTRGDLLWCAEQLDEADGYFRTPAMRNTLLKMVAWIARDVSPFRLPQNIDEQIDRAWVWVTENVEVLKRKRKTLMHRDVMGSDYLSGETLRRYDRIRDDFRLACAICAILFKNDKERDDGLVKRIIVGVHQYYGETS